MMPKNKDRPQIQFSPTKLKVNLMKLYLHAATSYTSLASIPVNEKILASLLIKVIFI